MSKGPEKKYIEDPLKEELRRGGWRVEENRRIPEDLIIVEELARYLRKNGYDKKLDMDAMEIAKKIKEMLLTSDQRMIVKYLKMGVDVPVGQKKREIVDAHVDLVSEEVDRNEYLAVFQARVPMASEWGSGVPDCMLFINGIPVVILEFKYVPDTVQDTGIGAGISQIKGRMSVLPELFEIAPIAMVLTNKDFRYFSPDPKHPKDPLFLHNWRKIDGKKPYQIAASTVLSRGILTRFIKDYIVYNNKIERRILPRYMQYEAVERIRERVQRYLDAKNSGNVSDAELENLRRMLVWMYQGTGKTYSMMFAAYVINKEFVRAGRGGTTTIFVVDRTSLENQTVGEYLNAIPWGDYGIQIRTFGTTRGRVPSIREFVSTLKRDRPFAYATWFALQIAKFGGRSEEELSEEDVNREIDNVRALLESDEYKKQVEEVQKKDNIVLIVDEVHRSLYGLLGETMQLLFKSALKIGYTGTPKIESKAGPDTFDLFGDPIYIYWVDDAIRDRTALPVYILPVISEIGLNEEALKKVEYIKKLVREYTGDKSSDAIVEFDENVLKELRRNYLKIIMSSENVIWAITGHILAHFFGIGEYKEPPVVDIEVTGEGVRIDGPWKALVVAPDRETAHKYMRALQEKLKEYLIKRGMSEIDAQKIAERLIVLIVSVSAGTDQELERTIVRYYKETWSEKYAGTRIQDIPAKLAMDFKTEAKDPTDMETPRIAVVTGMLLTGYDLPALKVLYVSKIMRKHTLLQALGRVNRPYSGRDKGFGLVVDYTGILPLLVSEAKAIYERVKREEGVGRSFSEFSENVLTDLRTLANAGRELRTLIKKYCELREGTDMSTEDILNSISLEIRRIEIECEEEISDCYGEGYSVLTRIKGIVNEVYSILSAYGPRGPHWLRLRAKSTEGIDSKDVEYAIGVALEIVRMLRILGGHVSVAQEQLSSRELIEEIADSIVVENIEELPLIPVSKLLSGKIEEEKDKSSSVPAIGGPITITLSAESILRNSMVIEHLLRRMGEEYGVVRPMAEDVRALLREIVETYKRNVEEAKKVYRELLLTWKDANRVLEGAGVRQMIELVILSTFRRMKKIQWRKDVTPDRVAQALAREIEDIIERVRATGNAEILISQKATVEQIRGIVVRVLATNISNIREALIPTAEAVTSRIVEVLKHELQRGVSI